jgi:hypothetical protein
LVTESLSVIAILRMEYPLVYIFKKNKFLKITIIVIIFIRSKVTNNTEKRKHLTCINTKTEKSELFTFRFHTQ